MLSDPSLFLYSRGPESRERSCSHLSQLSQSIKMVKTTPPLRRHAHRAAWPRQSLIEIVFPRDSSSVQLAVKTHCHAYSFAQWTAHTPGIYSILRSPLQHRFHLYSLTSRSQASLEKTSLYYALPGLCTFLQSWWKSLWPCHSVVLYVCTISTTWTPPLSPSASLWHNLLPLDPIHSCSDLCVSGDCTWGTLP